MIADPASERVQAVTARAAQTGLLLVRAHSAPYWWRLLKASGGALVLTARTLEEIEHKLGSVAAR